MNIKKNVRNLFSEIPKKVKVVAATKKQPTENIKQAVEAEIKIIGENIIQEAEKKFSEFDFEVEKHFIGNLQSNKAKKAVELFNCIQSVDSIKLAKKIDSACLDFGKKMPVFIELNLGEEQKFGVKKENLLELSEEINSLHQIQLNGLMFVAPFFEEPKKAAPFFIKAKKEFDEMKRHFPLEFLSMGMTQDYSVAIENGSNMIRVGTKIFGERI